MRPIDGDAIAPKLEGKYNQDMVRYAPVIEGYTEEDVRQAFNDGYSAGKEQAVHHGRWKYYHKQNKAVCTECSFERDLDADFGKAVSCPNCGAKMDGAE